MSRRIGKLERTLGVRLLERTTRHVSLTLAGREFVHTARSLLWELDSALLHMRDVGAQPAGEITLACVSSAVQHFLPNVIQRFHAQHPRIRVRILDGSANEVLAAVLRFEADFGVNFIGTQEPEIEFQVVLEDPFVLACRDDHRLAKSRSVKWSALENEEFMVVTKSSGNRLILDVALAGLKVRPTWFFEVRHISALLGLVEAGLGVAAVPRISMPRKGSSRLVGVSLVEPPVARTLGLIQRRARPLSPAAQHLYRLLAGSSGAVKS
jgi:DNA-binding transcriptional LysR family regulator